MADIRKNGRRGTTCAFFRSEVSDVFQIVASNRRTGGIPDILERYLASLIRQALRSILTPALLGDLHKINFAIPITPVAPLNFAERCDDAPKGKATHALLVRWGDCELEAVGIPAITAVVVLLLLGARWLGLF